MPLPPLPRLVFSRAGRDFRVNGSSPLWSNYGRSREGNVLLFPHAQLPAWGCNSRERRRIDPACKSFFKLGTAPSAKSYSQKHARFALRTEHAAARCTKHGWLVRKHSDSPRLSAAATALIPSRCCAPAKSSSRVLCRCVLRRARRQILENGASCACVPPYIRARPRYGDNQFHKEETP